MIMKDQAEQTLHVKKYNPLNIHEGDLTAAQKLEDYEDLFAYENTEAVSVRPAIYIGGINNPEQKEKEGSKDEEQKKREEQRRLKMIDDYDTYQTAEYNVNLSKAKIHDDFQTFKEHLSKQQKQVQQKQLAN